MQLIISGVMMPLHITHARLEMHLNPDHTVATSGIIGGIIETEALVAEIAKVAASFDQTFCDPSSPTLQSIMNQMQQASDIMKDGTQNPNLVCDGISIGLGFDMRSVQLGPIAPFAPLPPDPCAPPP